MKTSVYDRIPTSSTGDLMSMRRMLIIRYEQRDHTPRRHDYLGKCLIRATQVLESRGVLPLPTVSTIRSEQES